MLKSQQLRWSSMMPILTKELEDTISFDARAGFADDLIKLAEGTYLQAIDEDNSMHVGSLSDEDRKRGFEQTTTILNAAREIGIDSIDWINWRIVISPVRQQPVIFIEVKFEIMMAHKSICESYVYQNIDEADEVVINPIEGNVTHTKVDPQINNITGTYIQCIFDYENTKLPMLIQFDANERVSAESAWEYQVVGMGEKIDVVAIALNLRFLKHAGDRMNVLKGQPLFEAIQDYYNNLFHQYGDAQRDANRYTKSTRGVFIGDPDTEATLRQRMRKRANNNDSRGAGDYQDQSILDFPSAHDGIGDAFDWLND